MLLSNATYFAQQHVVNNANAAVAMDKNAAIVRNMLDNVAGTSFASLTQATRVATAAAHKARTIVKVSVSNVMLANNLNAFTSIYRNKVEREVGKEFELSDTWFHHTDCFSIVKHNKKDDLYLYAIYNNTTDTVFLDADTGAEMSRQDVAELLTPSARKKLLDNTSEVYNVKNDVTHNVTVRTISLANVVELKANGHIM